MRHLARLLAAAVGVLLVVAPAGDAYVIGGLPWPGDTITVANTTRYWPSLAEAMHAWNAADVGVRFVAVREPATADVVVRYGPGRTRGHGTLGFNPRGGRVQLSQDLTPRSAALVAAHELGHVLGLHHESRRCAVMNPTFDPRVPDAGCALAHCRELWRCLLTKDDVAGAVELYRLQRPALVPPPVRDVVVRPGKATVLAWRSPAWPRGRLVLVRAARGHWCSASPFRGPGRLELARIALGSPQSLVVHTPGRGTWCTGIWVQARDTGLPSRPVYLRFTVP